MIHGDGSPVALNATGEERNRFAMAKTLKRQNPKSLRQDISTKNL